MTRRTNKQLIASLREYANLERFQPSLEESRNWRRDLNIDSGETIGLGGDDIRKMTALYRQTTNWIIDEVEARLVKPKKVKTNVI